MNATFRLHKLWLSALVAIGASVAQPAAGQSGGGQYGLTNGERIEVLKAQAKSYSDGAQDAIRDCNNDRLERLKSNLRRVQLRIREMRDAAGSLNMSVNDRQALDAAIGEIDLLVERAEALKPIECCPEIADEKPPVIAEKPRAGTPQAVPRPAGGPDGSAPEELTPAQRAVLREAEKAHQQERLREAFLDQRIGELIEESYKAAEREDCEAFERIIDEIQELTKERSRARGAGSSAPGRPVRRDWLWPTCPPPQPSAPAPHSSAGAPPSDPFARVMLDAHNRARAEAGSPPLRWNPELAAGAATYAQALSQGGQLQHASRVGRRTMRENLSQSPRGTNSPQALVQRWINEKRLFRPGIYPNVCTGDWSQCAHYTQIIWSRTTDLGCAVHSDARFDWLVCRYSPPGNADGKPVIDPAALASVRRRCPPVPLATGIRR